MAQTIAGDQVRHVAHLARLKLTDEEIHRYAAEISGILDYVDLLNELDTSSVEPTAHPLPLRNVLREDEIRPSIGPEDALANAPQRQDTFFRVPKVLQQDGV